MFLIRIELHKTLSHVKVLSRREKKGYRQPRNELKMSEGAENASAEMKRNTSLLSISHDKDVDGLNSSAIVWRYAKSKGLDFNVILTDYGAFEQVFSAVAQLRNTLIVVTDLGIDETTQDVVISCLSRAIAQGCRIVWLDHHQWSEKSITALLSLSNKPVLKINHDYCASEIAYKVLMPRDRICEELATIAHDTDFNLREMPAANALTDAVSVLRFGAIDKREEVLDALYPVLSKLAENGIAGVWDITTHKFKDMLLGKRVENYRREKVKKMRKALSGHCDYVLYDRLIRVVEIPSGLTSTDMGTFASDPENLKLDGEHLEVADLLLMLSQGGMLGVRRGRETVLCNMAAKLFNGGGHPYAAGGEYGLYENFQAVCDDIFQTLSRDRAWVVE
jgi:oligoribonuclease NrnB/cAMP/cGMP phosphodiesterase (DHH superfamily)